MKYIQKGGETIKNIIENHPESHIITTEDVINGYPEKYIGYNVYIPPSNIPFTTDEQYNELMKGSGYILPNGNVDFVKLYTQILKDVERQIMIINDNAINKQFLKYIGYPDWTGKIDNIQVNLPSDTEKMRMIIAMRKMSQVDFSEVLSQLFPNIIINEEILLAIYELSKDKIFIISWAVIPFMIYTYQNIGIEDIQTITKMESYLQQTAFLNNSVIVYNFVTLDKIFYGNLQPVNIAAIERFGQTLSKIECTPTTTQTIKNGIKIIECIKNIPVIDINFKDGYGICVVPTILYIDLEANTSFLIWTNPIWRNAAVEQYYNLIKNSSPPVSQSIVTKMNGRIFTDENDEVQQILVNIFSLFLKNVTDNAYRSEIFEPLNRFITLLYRNKNDVSEVIEILTEFNHTFNVLKNTFVNNPSQKTLTTKIIAFINDFIKKYVEVAAVPGQVPEQISDYETAPLLASVPDIKKSTFSDVLITKLII